MRILHLISGLGIGGAERQLCLLSAKLARRGIRQQVVAMTTGGRNRHELESSGIDVIELGVSRGAVSLRAIWELRQLITQSAPDIVHSWMYHANLAATIATLGVPGRPTLIWAIRSSLESSHTYKRLTRLVIEANKWCSGLPARIVFNSRSSALQHANNGFDMHGQLTIANGIDVDKFSPSPRMRGAIRASLGLREDQFVVGNAARLDPSKDHPALLAAFAQFAGKVLSACLIMCGDHVNDSNGALVTSLHKLKIRDRVILLGERTDMADVMASWDVGLSSSIREGFPNMIAECMACGVPCVTTDVGDSSDIVGDTGFVVPAGNIDSLAQGLDRASALTPSARQSLGLAARARIEQLYSVDQMIQRYLDLYAELMSLRVHARSAPQSMQK